MKLGLSRSLATSNKGVLTNAQQIANNFEARVIDDSGVFESKSCLVAQLTILSNIE
jgi:hypothetical protein